MNRVLQGRRQLILEARRLGSYRGYDNSYCGRKKVNDTVIVSDPVIKSDTNCLYICKHVSNFETK